MEVAGSPFALKGAALGRTLMIDAAPTSLSFFGPLEMGAGGAFRLLQGGDGEGITTFNT